MEQLFSDEPVLEPVVLDRSTLANRANCPFMAEAIESGKVKDGGYFAEVGTEGHRVLSEAMESCGPDSEALAGWIEAEMTTARPDLQPEVIRSLKGVGETIRRIGNRQIIGIEKQYSTEYLKATANRGPLILTCCMDLVIAGRDNSIIHVHDYKTGWKKIDKASAFDMFQTQFYSWVIWRVYPDVNTIHFWYEQTRYGYPAYVRVERDRDFFNFEGRIQKTVELYLTGSVEAWPYPDKCAWCPATAICPYVVGEAKNLNADPQEYLKQYIAAKARLDAMEKDMKAYCKKHGEIRSDDQVFGYKEPAKKVTYKLYKDEPKEHEKVA